MGVGQGVEESCLGRHCWLRCAVLGAQASCQQNTLPGDWKRGWVPVAAPRAPTRGSLCAGSLFWRAGDPNVPLFSQAAQNLIVLAREEAGAEKIFQSDGVRLLTRLLDTAKADLMLAALRTLVGLCSGHRSRVGATGARPSCTWGPRGHLCWGGSEVRWAGEHQWPLPVLCCSLAAEQRSNKLSPARPEL